MTNLFLYKADQVREALQKSGIDEEGMVMINASLLVKVHLAVLLVAKAYILSGEKIGGRRKIIERILH